MESELRSQLLRRGAAEIDPLRLGAGWSMADLAKAQILIESTFGDSHPGSAHLDGLVGAILLGIAEGGGKAAKYYCTDICDGQAQGHAGMDYSLASREAIADMAEIHAMAAPFDGVVFVSTCDKAIPAHLKAMGRLDLPSVFVPGGVMSAGPNMLTLEQIGMYQAMYQRGEITRQELEAYQRTACPTCGACSFMGTAATMQILGEVLGLAIPGAALIPAASGSLLQAGRRAGKLISQVIGADLRPSRIITPESFENAIMVHAAIAGSSNAVLHLPAIAYEFGMTVEADLFDRLHRQVPYLVNVRPTGKYPADFFWRAGGALAVIRELRDLLHMDAMTVTGKTLGQNLDELTAAGFFESRDADLKPYNIDRREIIRPVGDPIAREGSIAILKGTLAPLGSVTKHAAISPHMRQVVLRARVFESETEARDAVYAKKVKPGEAVILRYQGPRATGMPEMFYTTEAIASDPELEAATGLITDGRFSGATRGPAIGHVSPEAAEGGPIALVEDGDLIRIDIPGRRLDVVGAGGVPLPPDEVEAILQARKRRWTPRQPKYTRGVLGRYMRQAASPIHGGHLP